MFTSTGKSLSGLFLILISAILLSACQTNKEKAGPPILNGNWASSDGVYVAEFRNGRFRAVANDTGGVISEGEYVALSETRVQIKWRGTVSGQENQAECNKPSADQLDCVDLNGNRFTLRRNA